MKVEVAFTSSKILYFKTFKTIRYHLITSEQRSNLKSLLFKPISFIEPIFHCNAKPLTLGPIISNASQSCPIRASNAQREPQRLPVEYSLHSVHESLVCIGHVQFMLFVSITFPLGSQLKQGFWWNIGFTLLKRSCISKL